MSNLTGINLANNTTKHARPKADLYQTPPEVTQALIDFLVIDDPIWECACGEGMMTDVFIANGYDVISTDLHDYGYGEAGVDFTKQTDARNAEWIITNPPFSLSAEFISKGIEFLKANEVRGMALLLKSQYWHARKRIDLFNMWPPMYILPLTWRPDFAFGERGGAPTMECIWTVWTYPYAITEYYLLPKPQ